ncbi:MAG: Na/Pi symporter, partial [Faecalibacterium prausnitzii]|nr:Na/Pi symporter [Faecalibacterium prausnitzii]
MTIFNVFSLLGGLALFLFGMDIMGKALEKQAGGKLQKILSKLTDNPIKGFFLGLGVTAVIQSSSATTVMVVGFVNSGIMELHQAIGIIMGSNVGTTVTSWVLSLSGLQGDSLFIQLLKPTSFSPVLAFIGILLYMCKSEKKKGVGTIFIGFAVLMTGMEAMSTAMKPLANEPWFTDLFLKFSNPLLGVIAGAVLTAVIQSSSATTVMVVGFVNSGIMELHQAVGIIMGSNIGTTATSWLLSLTGIQGDSFWLQLCKPVNFCPILAFIGVLLYMQRSERKKGVGTIMLGFAVLMTGMEAMSTA